MFGDPFFTHWPKVMLDQSYKWFSSPCLGILFSHFIAFDDDYIFECCFRPHVWGFFFHLSLSCTNCKVYSFRPHVWGFFFHNREPLYYIRGKVVFVPMFGDSFFTRPRKEDAMVIRKFSSPCLGILFSLLSLSCTNCKVYMGVFVTIFGDSFFTTMLNVLKEVTINSFRPHVWGFFFHRFGDTMFCVVTGMSVFVPMFGDSFFTRKAGYHGRK